jgi:hypothetical protein
MSLCRMTVSSLSSAQSRRNGRRGGFTRVEPAVVRRIGIVLGNDVVEGVVGDIDDAHLFVGVGVEPRLSIISPVLRSR